MLKLHNDIFFSINIDLVGSILHTQNNQALLFVEDSQKGRGSKLGFKWTKNAGRDFIIVWQF